MGDVDALRVGDRVQLSGGYDMEPKWLNGETSRLATVSKFIPGQNETSAAVVELDTPISVDGLTGRILVLELRFKGASWALSNAVHIELCDFDPESKSWQQRKHGKWIESHANCVRI